MKINLAKLGAITDLAQGDVWDGAQLAAETERRIQVLQQRGITRRDFVVIAHGGTPSFFADLFAVWSLGACAVCINPRLTEGELANIVGFVDAAAILVSDGTALEGRGLKQPLFSTAAERVAGGLEQSDGAAALDDPALILFTSGTTGDPKGVVHSFRSLLARIALNQVQIGEAALAKTLCVLPTHFGHGLIGNCLTPLLAGNHLFLSPEMSLRNARSLGAMIDDHGITFMSSVPAFWKIVLKMAKAPAAPNLAQVSIGSAPLSADLWRSIMTWTGTDNVVNMYGITETANWVAGASARDLAPVDGLIGTMWGGTAAVLDGAGRLASEGEGELLLQSPSLMVGYHKRDDLTQAVLRDGWFHTGDIGRIDDQGVICLTGRQKSEINRAGIKIHPEEVDLLLERHDGILEACCFGVPDDISGEIVGAAICLTEGATLTKDELRRWCLERIKRDAVPERWYFVPEIPKTDRGKVNRANVMAYCLEAGAA